MTQHILALSRILHSLKWKILILIILQLTVQAEAVFISMSSYLIFPL